nr:hypothetical protein [Tanacetum cinerariifolium]
MAMEWLTKGCWSGDSLVFYYAGHGSIWLIRMEMKKMRMSVAGKILDDEVNTILVAPLPHEEDFISGKITTLYTSLHYMEVLVVEEPSVLVPVMTIKIQQIRQHYTKCNLRSQLQEALVDGGIVYLQWRSPSVAWILRFGPVGHIHRHSDSYIKTTSYQRWQDEQLGS